MGIVKGDRVGIWAPNCAEWTLTQYATAKIGAILVNINPAYRTRELEFVLNQSGSTLLVAAERLKTSDYAAMIAEVRPRCPELDAVVLLGSPEWHALLERGRQRGPRCARRHRARHRRPHQHPVHLGHHRLPEGRDAVAPQHPQQRVLRRRAVQLHRGGPDLHPGAVLPLLRHGHGQPRARPATARAWSSRRRPSTRSRPCRPCRPNAAPRCTACPPCSSPSCPSPTSPTTTCPACAPASWPARRARSR